MISRKGGFKSGGTEVVKRMRKSGVGGPQSPMCGYSVIQLETQETLSVHFKHQLFYRSALRAQPEAIYYCIQFKLQRLEMEIK